ncbi:redoxin family protein [Singulisphaera sp. Ch08]|uniref:Redoxin family protein n=1 Tax=Singulisphaera sp. Ch08 TaxID=3120278 RepID=A0AAU7CBJ6_9BACT
MRRRCRFRPAIILALILGLPARGDGDDRSPIGQRVDNLQFKDIRFLTRSLDDFGKKKAFVVVATNTTCPVVQRYLPVLAQLEKTYRDRGVQFLALNVGPDDSITEMAARSVEAKTEFPFVKDIDSACARKLGLRRTPESVVIDSQSRIRYRGRIDDQFRLTGERPQASRHDLRDALEDILAGREVARSETSVDGCLITAPDPSRLGKVPTFAEDVAPLVQRHCQDCHHRGAEAPFPLVTYRDVASQAAMIEEVVGDRRMPPWFASDKHGRFANRRGLSETERETFLGWIQGGTPRGNSGQEPKLREFPTGKWRIGTPDLTTTMLLAHEIPATGYVDYRYAILPFVFTHDTWVQSIEIISDNSRAVHHANLAYNKLGERPRQENFITGRVPGGDPMVLDDGTAYLIPKGSVLGLQIHYTTTGKAERVRLSVGLKFPRTVVRKQLQHRQVYTTRFEIPPFAPAHPVSASRQLNFDATGVGLFAHMHVRGKDMTFLARHPNGLTDTLLLIPNYQFDWQQSFRWTPGTKKFPKGTTFEVLAHFDNSEFNPFNPDPKQTVGNGDQTFNEMMYGFYFYTRDDEDLALSIDPATGAVLEGNPGATSFPQMP